MQRTDALALALRRRRARLRHRMLGVEMGEGVHFALAADPVETGARVVLGGNRAARDRRGGLGRGERRLCQPP